MIDFKQHIDLLSFYQKFIDHYEIRLPKPYQFPAAVVWLPKMTLLLYPNGKCVCAGINQKKMDIFTSDGNLAISPIVDTVYDLVKTVTETEISPSYEVVNIVTQINLDQHIDLNEMVITQRHCIYEPETFPALIMKTVDPRHTFLVFSTGRIIAHIPHPKLNGKKFTDTLTTMVNTIKTRIPPTLYQVQCNDGMIHTEL